MIVRHARAARVIFAALQNLRTERGPTRTMLEADGPASATFMTITDVLRAKSRPALEAVMEECAAIDCVGAQPDISAGFRDSIDKLVAARKEVDAALLVPLAQRRANVARDFGAVISDVVGRLEKMSKVDGETAELIEIKELAWLARDGVGLERTALIDGMNAKALTPALRKKADDLRARAEVTWTVVRELAARPGVPVAVADAINSAHGLAFGTYEQIRERLYTALTSGQVPSISSEELIERSNGALDALMEVSNAA